jgi:hypothetical protein
MLDWASENQTLLWWMGLFSVFTFVGTLIFIPILVVRIPTDYFVRSTPNPGYWPARHPVIRVIAIVSKNVLGATFIVTGIAMLVLPGQGVITILIGIMLLDFPGKRRFELWLIEWPALLRGINWIRRRAHRPPLQVPKTHSLRLKRRKAADPPAPPQESQDGREK